MKNSDQKVEQNGGSKGGPQLPYTTITACRGCDSKKLLSVLNLGPITLNGFPLPSEPSPPAVPIEAVLCGDCQLFQLRHTADPNLMFKNFWYASGITQTMVAALQDVVDGCCLRTQLRGGDTVIDIGSNDSTLLDNYGWNLERIGFEPATNMMDLARRPGMTIVNDYFSLKALREVSGKKAKVITAIAMFYDIPDPRGFCKEIAAALASDGIFCIQQSYLPDMLRNNDVGNLTHEHLMCYSLRSLEPILKAAGLRCFDVQQNDVNGGSFRTYICHESGPYVTKDSVLQMRFEERAMGLDLEVPYRKFADRCESIKRQVNDFVKTETQTGGKVYLYAASTKGNLMSEYWGLDRGSVSGAAERDNRKVGREMVAGRIPIVSEVEARSSATAFVVLAFAFKKEMLAREAEFLSRGNKMVFANPEFEVIGG